MTRRKLSPKIAGIFGILGPIIAFALIAVAIKFNISWWNWYEYTLSHLGNIGDSYTLKIFSIGLIIAGFMEIPFALGLPYLFKEENKVAEFGIGILLIGVVSIIIQGFFPSGTLVHDRMGGVLYIELAIGMVLLAIGSLRNSKQRPWGLLLLGLIIQLVFIFALNNQIPDLHYGGAINETIAISTYSLFSIFFGGRLLTLSDEAEVKSYKFTLLGIIVGTILLITIFLYGGF